MKAEELRLGNIVMVDNPKYHPDLKGVPLEIVGINTGYTNGDRRHWCNLEHINQDANKFYDSYSQQMKFINPIPLTEEILLKCGFEKINHINGYTFYSYSRKKRSQDKFFCEIYERWTKIGGSMTKQHIQYLHQLQNVYFSLVGAEMEVSL